MVASRKLTLSQTGGETETKMSNAMAANAKKRPGNAGETILSEFVCWIRKGREGKLCVVD